MTSCVVKWCKRPKEGSKKNTDKTYHRFPKNGRRRQQWIEAVRLERKEDDWLPSYASRVCSIHFDIGDIYLSPTGYRMINKSAVPICTMVHRNYSQSQDQSLSLPLVPENSEIQKETLKQHSQEQDPLTSKRAHQESHNHEQQVKCPNYTYEFNIKVDQSNEDFVMAKKKKTQSSVDTNIASYSTPTDVPSSDIYSVNTHLIKECKRKSLLATKRLLKIKILQRQNKRLKTKNLGMKYIIKEFIKKKGFDYEHSDMQKALEEFPNYLIKKKGYEQSDIQKALEGFPNNLISNLIKKHEQKGRTVLKFPSSATLVSKKHCSQVPELQNGGRELRRDIVRKLRNYIFLELL